MRNPHQVEAGA